MTACSLIYHAYKVFKRQVLVCAPSNVAVDHLAEKLQLTGLNVLRFCAKGREGISSSVSHLTLHEQLKSENYVVLNKLFQLKVIAIDECWVWLLEGLAAFRRRPVV